MSDFEAKLETLFSDLEHITGTGVILDTYMPFSKLVFLEAVFGLCFLSSNSAGHWPIWAINAKTSKMGHNQ